MGLTGKPYLVIGDSKHRLSPLAWGHANCAYSAKYDYLQHQTAAIAFIALSYPEYAERDIVQTRDPNWSEETHHPFKECNQRIKRLEEDALKIASKSECDVHLSRMENSKILTHPIDREDLPIDDHNFGYCIRQQINHYQFGHVNRKQAVSILIEEAKHHLRLYHAEIRELIHEARKAHSRKWVDQVLLELNLTKDEACNIHLGKVQQAKTVAYGFHERISPFGNQRMVRGKFRKPLRTALVTAAVFTMFTGMAYVLWSY
ncbi:uncharacterized protein RCC_08710 [Ramularia collo-cygni]|uniref:Uncharacterized protein n=1 Tax=Ramularia collo-cygni TaxID=112498 RepID=A0A2D3VD85_9PEZI|nr:uncharacterized protein RCC_08710 [Ramularia collo-cygni]CZT23002.1 uncharacterized protein RCC_08710 [Ramularia collo-cygni]